MRGATFSQPPPRPWHPVTQLRVGRLILLAMGTLALLIGGAIWLLSTQARPLTTPMTDSTAWPAWLKQAQTYPAAVPDPPKAAPVPDPNAAILAKLAALQAQLEEQRQAIEALKKRPSGTTIVQPQQGQAAQSTPPPKAPAPMLFVAHDVKEASPKPAATEYTLAPGATKLPCLVETAINSEVEGYFTAKVSTNVYDTATGPPSARATGVDDPGT